MDLIFAFGPPAPTRHSPSNSILPRKPIVGFRISSPRVQVRLIRLVSHENNSSLEWSTTTPSMAFLSVFVFIFSRNHFWESMYGSFGGHNRVEHLISIARIQIRTGGMCHTGVRARLGGVNDDELTELYQGG